MIRAAVNRGQPVVGDHFKKQVAAAFERRALARKQSRQREVVAAQLPGKWDWIYRGRGCAEKKLTPVPLIPVDQGRLRWERNRLRYFLR